MRFYLNKKPDADLHSKYWIHLETGFVITLLLLIVLFRMPLDFSGEFEITLTQADVISLEEIVRTEQVQQPPPPPRPPTPRVVPDEEIAEAQYFDLDVELEPGVGSLWLPPPPRAPEQTAEPEPEPESEIFVIVEQMPVLIGGLSAIYDRLVYPEGARQAGIEGRVVIQFVIDEHGRVTQPVVIRGIGGGCDEAALKAISDIRFQPGRQRGRPVRVRYSIPIVFRLSQ